MDQSRGVTSAETVAFSNKPSVYSFHRTHKQLQRLSVTAAAATTTTTTGGQATVSRNYITESIQQRVNPSTSSLPALLARSLTVAAGALAGASCTRAHQLNELQFDVATNNYHHQNGLHHQRSLLQHHQQPHQQFRRAFLTATDNNQLQLQQVTQEQSWWRSFMLWWDQYWSSRPYPSDYTISSIALLACLITTIMFLIVVGNLLVCIAIFTEKSLKPTQNWFIASLAVSDMLLGLVVMPFSLARELMGYWYFGPLWCDMHEAIDVLLTTASINTLCLISLDRYWSITQAVSYLKKRTPRRGAFMIAFVWVFSAAVSLPPLFGWKKPQSIINANSTTSPSNLSNRTGNQQAYSSTSLSSLAAPLPGMQVEGERGGNGQWDRAATTTIKTSIDEGDAVGEFGPGRQRDRRHAQQRLARAQRTQELATPLFSKRQAAYGDDPSLVNDSQGDISITNDQDQPFNSNPMQPRPAILSDATTTTSPTQEKPTTQDYPQCQLSDDVGYVLYSALGSFYIPCAVMVFTYIKIFLAARSRARRAINKQSRSQAAANKRLAVRRAMNTTNNANNRGGACAGGDGGGKQSVNQEPQSGALTTTGAFASGSGAAATQSAADHHAAAENNAAPTIAHKEPIIRGKIVIVERKKSLAVSGQSIGHSQSALSAAASGVKNSCSGANNYASCDLEIGNHDRQLNTATYSCSDLARAESSASHHHQRPISGGCGETQQQQPHRALSPPKAAASINEINTSSHHHHHNLDQMNSGAVATLDDGQVACILTTSGVKQASPSALNSSASNDSSMVTVMTASMADVPVTRFHFQSPRLVSSSSQLSTSAQQGQEPGEQQHSTMTDHDSCNDEHMAAVSSAADGSDENRKAAALLKAISQLGEKRNNADVEGGDFPMLKEAMSLSSSRPDSSDEENDFSDGGVEGNSSAPGVVVDMRPSAKVSAAHESSNRDATGNELQEQQRVGSNLTNETCFMTIEEDSDVFDAQTGRTIMMIAGNASQKQANNLGDLAKGQSNMMTMMPPAAATNQQQQGNNNNNNNNNSNQQQGQVGTPVQCNSVMCRRQQHQQAVMATRSASSYCGSSMTINDDDIDDCVDDELLTDDCNGYSVSCGLDQYCPGVSSCPHCQECEQEQRQQQQQQLAHSNRHLSITDSPARKQLSGSGTGAQIRAQVQHQHHHHHHRCNISETEAQSMTGDDNLSLTEYRSNEDSSSILCHDVLDATTTETTSSQANAKQKAKLNIADGNEQSKKPSIGFRLARLGSSAPLSGQSGGLLALASSQHQQQQSGGGGTRNLKALRQNFFLKLNQLTAKSAKHETKNNSKKFADDKTSPTGKSSAHSSGTSYEPSVDCPTTSNVHSIDYHQETTVCEPDDYDQQTSGDSQPASKYPTGQQSQRTHSRASNNNNLPNQQQSQSQQQSQQNGDDYNSKSNDDLCRRSQPGSEQAIAKFSESAGGTSVNQLDKSDNNNTNKGAGADDRTLLLRSGDTKSGDIARQSENVGGNNLPNESAQAQNGKQQRLQDQQHQQHRQQHRQQQQRFVNNRTKISGSLIGFGGGQGSGHNNHGSNAMNSSVGGSLGASRLASDNERHKRKLAKARERRATLILGLIMAAFICSWMPFFTFYVLRATCQVCADFLKTPGLEPIVFWAGYCNSAINPIIYTIFNRDFRKAFRKILFKCL